MPLIFSLPILLIFFVTEANCNMLNIPLKRLYRSALFQHSFQLDVKYSNIQRYFVFNIGCFLYQKCLKVRKLIKSIFLLLLIQPLVSWKVFTLYKRFCANFHAVLKICCYTFMLIPKTGFNPLFLKTWYTGRVLCVQVYSSASGTHFSEFFQ